VFIVAPRSLNLDDTLEWLASQHSHEVIKVGTAGQSSEDHQQKVESSVSEIKAFRKNVIVVGAPRTLKECYLLKEGKVVPTKIMFLNDSVQSMANFYLTLENPVTDSEA
jgi:hypothetical protein